MLDDGFLMFDVKNLSINISKRN